MTPTSWLPLVTVVAVAVLAVRVRPRAVARTIRSSPARRTRWWRRADRPLDEITVAGWCERVAAGVRAGRSLTAAVLEAGSPTPFPHVDLALRRGRSLAAALGSSPVDPSTPAGLVLPVVLACADVGGAAAPPLQRVAATLHARAAERAERATNSAQARLSARVLTIVPFGVLALLAATEPSVRDALVAPPGTMCLALGATLNVAGWCWMRSIIGRAT